LLAVSGASNVTGVIPAVHRLAEKVHAAGGRILVDAAQLAPHRAIDMRAHDDPGHLDFVAMSAHKLYAPFGSGALVGPRDAFTTRPDHSGGGTINLVTLDDVVWAHLPDREEAGTPNVLGAIAFAAATSILEDIGFARIAADEAELTRHALSRLAHVPSVTVYGPTGPAATDASRRLGIVSFGVDGLDHAYVAAVLGYEHGIGVRSGCFCAQPYIAHLLRLSAGARARWLELARRNDHRGTPGLVRISFGCYNDITDVDRAVDALEQAVVGGRGTYHAVRDGSFVPAGYYEPALFHLSDPQCAARTLGT
jgi:cysteine desulfurase/selenocysteine lyase